LQGSEDGGDGVGGDDAGLEGRTEGGGEGEGEGCGYEDWFLDRHGRGGEGVVRVGGWLGCVMVEMVDWRERNLDVER